MLLVTDLDDVESLDIDKFVFGLRVPFVAGTKVVINKGAEDDLGGLYAHFRSERHGSKNFAAELRSGQGPRKANISSSPFTLAFDLDILQGHSHSALYCIAKHLIPEQTMLPQRRRLPRRD